MKKKRSAFGDWFKAQYGRYPNPAEHLRLMEKLRNIDAERARVQSQLDTERRIADAWRDSAYGWNAHR